MVLQDRPLEAERSHNGGHLGYLTKENNDGDNMHRSSINLVGDQVTR